jgi:general secretion pathway protein D
MNLTSRMTRTLPLLALLLIPILSGCTSYNAFKRAQDFEAANEFDKAIVEYQRALDIDPENVHYQLALKKVKLEASRWHFDKGKRYMSAAQYDLAMMEFTLTVSLDPTNQYAEDELKKASIKMRERAAEVDDTMAEMKRRASLTKAQPPVLNPASDEPISLSFPKETSVKDIYKALGNAFGINIVYDQAVKDDKIAIELRDLTSRQALERVMQASGHFYKVLDEKTIIIIPDNAQTRRDYEDLVIQTFYLSNGDPEQVTNIIRTMLEARNVFPLKSLNAITIRDTADKVRIAEKIIEANDKALSEVVVQVELLEVDTNRLRDLGAVLSASGSVSLIDAAGNPISALTPDGFKNLGSDNLSITVPSITYSFIKSNSEARLLAQPQLRISEGEKASLHIGQKQPIPVSTLYTSTVPGQNQGPITSFQYQDIGIKIAIEPRVHHNREITLKLTVEVSNLAGSVSAQGTTPEQPIIGTRTIESTIRLKDGETNILAGLFRKDFTSDRAQTPFLGELPVIGRLFSKEKNTTVTTDVILTMTPHIIRVPNITEDDLAPMWVGTQNNLTFRGLTPRIESRTESDPFNAFPRNQPQQQQQTVPVAPNAQPQQEPPSTAPIQGGGAPSDPFKRPQPQEPPPQENMVLDLGAGTSAGRPAPRVAIQPAMLSIGTGEQQLVRVVGIDLDGLVTEELRLVYDTASVNVGEVSLGTAIAIDPVYPPTVSVSPEKGEIVIRSTDPTQPIRFLSGGELLLVALRATNPGEGYLVIDNLILRGEDGRRVPATISGGRATVAYR